MSSRTQYDVTLARPATQPDDQALTGVVPILSSRRAAERAWARLLRESARDVEEAQEAFAYRLAAAHSSGLSYRRIADMLDISYMTVKRRVAEVAS